MCARSVNFANRLTPRPHPSEPTFPFRDSFTMNDSARTKLAGLIFVLFGVWAIAIGLNIVHVAPSKDIPRWIVGVVGAAFALAGVAIFLRADSALPDASAPTKGVVLAQWLSATATPALLTGLCAWVSFGPGPRHFRSRGILTFMSQSPQSAETNGRIGFGVAAVLLAFMTVTTFVAGLRRFQGDADREAFAAAQRD
jgi:hypothetical protein